MKQQDPTWQQQRAREELLLRFLKAYDEGNLEVIGAILHQAEQDPELDTLIWDTFPTYLREQGIEPDSPEEQQKRLAVLRQQPIPSDWKKPEPLPLIWAEVAAHTQVEFTLHRTEYTDPPAIQAALNVLVQSRDLVPDHPDLRTIETLFSHYKLAIPSAFYESFLEMTQSLQAKRTG